VEYVRRPERTGFKAGALAHGMRSVVGELVAIFDADFLPPSDMLLASVPHFRDPRVGMIQARWGYLNRGASTFTEAQAIMLDAHFMIEHGGRAAAGLYFNFNGTAGVWRAAAIRDAGGWQSDTLTEDLDLSYRAQLRGWRFLFLPGLVCPGELPIEMGAFKSQQHRWAKGATQVMLKILPRVWASAAPLRTKVEATFHLTSNCAYLLMVIDATFFLVPSIVIRHRLGWHPWLVLDLPLFFFATVCHLGFFLAGQRSIFGSTRGRMCHLPALMALGIGLGMTNARAVVEALLGRTSDFVRTPKRGVGGGGRGRGLYRVELAGWEYLEVVLGLFYAGAIVWAISRHAWFAVPVLALFQNGFLFTGLAALLEQQRRHG
jgi:cellulose synthase/poly-beta-1,6-N-acetylglucosamine synthase-like glycosyltransferase